jgi:CHAD domain-containing protein
MPLYATRLESALRAAIQVQDVLGVYQDAFTATARLREYAVTVPADAGFRGELLALGEVIAAEQAAGKKARKRFVKEWPAFKKAIAGLGVEG